MFSSNNVMSFIWSSRLNYVVFNEVNKVVLIYGMSLFLPPLLGGKLIGEL